MEYERIHKVQTGIVSPSKLRMKFMGPHHQRKKDGSNSNSSRTSPAKLEDSEFAKNSLLGSQHIDFDGQAPCLEVPLGTLTTEAALNDGQAGQTLGQTKESELRDSGDTGSAKLLQMSKVDGGLIPHLRILEDENLDYDSYASSSSFEFHKGERSLHNPVLRSLLRPMPSKWNDAEKWIVSKQNGHANYSKKHALQNQTNRPMMTNMVRVSPESAGCDQKSSLGTGAETKCIDLCQPSSEMEYEKYSFVSSGVHNSSGQADGRTPLIDKCPQNKDLKEVVCGDLSCTKNATDKSSIVTAIRSVSMRDMGTEMTPMTSQEPSRTATPVAASTPLRSPNSSIPSTPRKGVLASTTMERTTNNSRCLADNIKRELSEEELRLKTRREILALGVQLGKKNIAEWASKDMQEKNSASVETVDTKEREHIEFERRAAAWEEVEKSKHMARYKHEEIKIQAWESQQKAKLEAEMQRIEARFERTRAQAQAKIMKKISMARQRSEKKRAVAEARKNRDAERTAAQAEQIRQTGRMPSSPYTCCGWIS